MNGTQAEAGMVAAVERTAAWLMTIACLVGLAATEVAAQASRLANTEWRLVEIQSMDDTTPVARPSDPSLYTMRLNGDGSVSMRLNCNRATGSWTAEPGADGSSGRFQFGPLAGTRALCPPPSLDERVTGQAQYVRSFLLKDGRLHLSLMADGGIFVWEPLTELPFEAEPDKALEAAILKASPSYTRETAGAGGASGRARYAYGRVDLNADGHPEVFAYVMGSVFCGTCGCNLLLFTTDPQHHYTLVNNFPISRVPVIVADERTAGWHDIVRVESGGGAPPMHVRYTFDGKKYVERGRTPADKPVQGRRHLSGKPTLDEGVPLDPPAHASAAPSGPAAPAPSKTGFSTVCGVSVGGKDYRYKCTVEGAAPGSTGKTVLHFPDNTVTLTWLAGGKATATFEGMKPQGITIATADGVTKFPFEDKVYFFVSDRTRAAEEIKKVR